MYIYIYIYVYSYICVYIYIYIYIYTYMYRDKSQCLARSSPYAGPSAGAEVARLRKWHVWCLRAKVRGRRTAPKMQLLI